MMSQFIDTQAVTENKKETELFLAIYFNDLEKVLEFKNQYPELYSKKGKFQIDENTIFDLTNLTLFNQTIWSDENWIDDKKPFVEKNRQQTEKMIDFWCSEFGSLKISRQIEYYHYCDFFYCGHQNDPLENEEIILDPIVNFIEKGFREVDLRLYKRVECFDFIEVENLLKQGAKTNIHFYDDESSSAFSRISEEVSFLATCQVIPEFELFETNGYNQNFDIVKMFGYLLGLAAHQEMYNLLNQYDEDE